ncbi:hypothetical protein PAL_GLEAN10017601 [Pteropus alecto]|uniref:Uncharacterized protein n=1 Tax=Pteropus alecto TaxID=9402 RepID=L5KXK2_PTEAL|nr:hypothetical protein PAL_GLEAN10017601 [Pteropus alecto]
MESGGGGGSALGMRNTLTSRTWSRAVGISSAAAPGKSSPPSRQRAVNWEKGVSEPANLKRKWKKNALQVSNSEMWPRGGNCG